MNRDASSPSSERIRETEASVAAILREMGVGVGDPDAVLTAPAFYDGPVLLKPGQYGGFAWRSALALGFTGYPLNRASLLTVREFSEMFVSDSFPEPPRAPLPDAAYSLRGADVGLGPGPRCEFPIAFVLGAGRSGTTLLRAMLDRHSGLWAPGELHFANYRTMAERAERVNPTLRFMPIPELAARCHESVAVASRRFRRWERKATPIQEVFEFLHVSDPEVTIVDKTPPYSTQRSTLDSIRRAFPRARFVHLVRNPHDVIASYVRMQFHRGDRALFGAPMNPFQMGEAVWTASTANAQQVIDEIGPERGCTIRYEDLTRDPRTVMEQVCAVLGRRMETSTLDPYRGQGEPGRITHGAGDPSVNQRTRLEARPLRRAFYPIGEPCRRLAARWGYET